MDKALFCKLKLWFVGPPALVELFLWVVVLQTRGMRQIVRDRTGLATVVVAKLGLDKVHNCYCKAKGFTINCYYE